MKLRAHQHEGVVVAYTFFCPGCKIDHCVVVKEPVKWEVAGEKNSPTYFPSILVTWHTWEPPVTAANLAMWKEAPWNQYQVMRRCNSFIRDGNISFLDECNHEFAGQTLPLPDVM
jgi:hypothetical protein